MSTWNFHTPWPEVPYVVVDTETTGPGVTDKAVEFAAVRFCRGTVITWCHHRCDPGQPISKEALEIHGIGDVDVIGKPPIEELFQTAAVREIIDGAQPVAYAADFDRQMVPASAFPNPLWPWLDVLVLVRSYDKYVPGSGRHKLEVTCRRHNILHPVAHSAVHDATATGHLMYKLLENMFTLDTPIGEVLYELKKDAAEQWQAYHSYKALNP